MAKIRVVVPVQHRRVTRWMRLTRAVWRDSQALWREFHRPLLIFLATILGGGWLYGELLVRAGYERLPYHDLPYIMIALMTFEPVGDPPPQWYLILFWYALPLIALYVVGRGAVDFVRLFFNRGERRSAWEEAVVSTYSNHFVVVGAGHVGLRVVRSLVEMGIDVVVVNLDESQDLNETLKRLGVRLIYGDARQRETLERARVAYADALIIASSDDFTNLEIGVRARELNDGMRIVVRMWDDQLSSHLKHSINAEVVSASDLAAPAFVGMAVGADISPMFQIHGTHYSLIRLQVEPGSFMCGITIDRLQSDNEVDVVLLERGEQVSVHPEGEIPVAEGDFVTIFSRHSNVNAIIARNRRRLNRET
ncbi:MAG: NAD-binding protein [Anaerolineae bacterium]|nr:NAD-binding protein [Anaerolineae bacterium]NUQ05436.1 potassium channel protein [Anaerolineae bacterium]